MPGEKESQRITNLILHFMSVIKRYRYQKIQEYSYTGDAKPEPTTGGVTAFPYSACFQLCLLKDPKITRLTRKSVTLSVISALGEDTPM